MLRPVKNRTNCQTIFCAVLVPFCSRPSIPHRLSRENGIHGKKVSLPRFFGSVSNRAETIRCRIGQAPGTRNGQEISVASTTQIPVIGTITFQSNSHRDRTRFIVRSPTTTRQLPAIDQKRHALCRGSRKRTRVPLFPHAKIDGSRSTRPIERSMHNGKTPDLSAPTIGNMFLATNVPNLISTEAPVSTFRRPCVITSD